MGEARTDGAIGPGLRYRAFLSYRTTDGATAEKLHAHLERYRVPKDLVGTEGDHGPVPDRLGPIFRDRDDARTAEDIETIIAQELSKSQQLIVLATPGACEPGSWVPREIELFRERRPGAPIHSVIGAGEPPRCFPAPLLTRRADGSLSAPMAADLRPKRSGGADGYRRALVKLAAGLAGVPFDLLWQRERRRRRARAFVLAAVAGVSLAAIGAAYAFVDGSRFVREQGEHLAVLAGRPGFNPPGYPRVVWTLDQKTNSLALPASVVASEHIVATAPGASIMAALDAITRPDYLAAVRLGQGEADLARSAALEILDSAAATDAERLNAGLVFSEVASRRDWPSLEPMLSSRRSESRLAAMRATFRIDSSMALHAYQTLPEAHRQALLNDLIKQMEGRCSPAIVSVLEDGLASSSNLPAVETVLDAAFRTGCELGVDGLMSAVSRASLLQAEAVARYAALVGHDEALAGRLAEALHNAQTRDWRIGDLVAVYGLVGPRTCLPALRRGLDIDFQATRIAAMTAMARQCSRVDLVAIRAPGDGPIELRLMEGERIAHTESIDMAREDVWLEVNLLLRLAVRRRWTNLVPSLRDLLDEVADAGLRAEVVRTLTRLGDRVSLNPALFSSNSLELRTAYIEHERPVDPTSIEARLLARAGSSDWYYEGPLGRVPLSPPSVARLEGLLSGDFQSRAHAACVLAMQGGPTRVARLLRDPDQVVRARATACVPFNDAAAELASGLPRQHDGFPLNGRFELRRQVRRKEALEAQLESLSPEDRAMRLALVDGTPAGFGLFGAGMRLWIAEARYQAELALASSSERVSSPGQFHPRARAGRVEDWRANGGVRW